MQGSHHDTAPWPKGRQNHEADAHKSTSNSEKEKSPKHIKSRCRQYGMSNVKKRLNHQKVLNVPFFKHLTSDGMFKRGVFLP